MSVQETSTSRAKSVVGVGLTATLIGLAFGGAPTAAAIKGGDTLATPGSPGDMNISVSQGERVDSDGTQGSFTNSVEGTQDSDGDQDAFDTQSWEAVPQDKPHTK